MLFSYPGGLLPTQMLMADSGILPLKFVVSADKWTRVEAVWRQEMEDSWYSYHC